MEQKTRKGSPSTSPPSLYHGGGLYVRGTKNLSDAADDVALFVVLKISSCCSIVFNINLNCLLSIQVTSRSRPLNHLF